MNCIIINDDLLVINRTKSLLKEIKDLVLIDTFYSTNQASKFIIENTIDLIFFDLEIDDENYYNFIKSIPQKTFVIFVYGSSSIITINDHLNINRRFKKFEKAINKARVYHNYCSKINHTITQENYFLI